MSAAPLHAEAPPAPAEYSVHCYSEDSLAFIPADERRRSAADLVEARRLAWTFCFRGDRRRADVYEDGRLVGYVGRGGMWVPMVKAVRT